VQHTLPSGTRRIEPGAGGGPVEKGAGVMLAGARLRWALSLAGRGYPGDEIGFGKTLNGWGGCIEGFIDRSCKGLGCH
jgi:hypothetical protein